jgi:hypothetical protein
VGSALAPYWEAQLAKERANAAYKRGHYEEAIALYSSAIVAMPCHSTLIALHLFNNRGTRCPHAHTQPRAISRLWRAWLWRS